MDCCYAQRKQWEQMFGSFEPPAGADARPRAARRQLSCGGGSVSERGSRGFSLIELTIVISIMGIMFAIVPSYLTYRRTQELKGAAQNIASQIRLARATAIMTGRTQRFSPLPELQRLRLPHS